jgi:hypothetical protein
MNVGITSSMDVGPKFNMLRGLCPDKESGPIAGQSYCPKLESDDAFASITLIGDSIDAHLGRVYIAKFGPLGTILLTLVVGLLSAVLMVLLFGALLVALPAVVLLVTAAIIAGLLRVYFQRSP